MRRSIALAIFLCALPPISSAAQPPTPGTDVAPLTVTPERMAPIPKVGVGAPQLSVMEIEAVERAAERCIGLDDDLRLERWAKELEGKLDSIARGTETADARIVLNVYENDYYEAAWMAVMRKVAREAAVATQAAERARRTADEIGQAAMESAEVTRQTAVNRMVLVRSILIEVRSHIADIHAGRADWRYPRMTRQAGAAVIGPAPAYADLGLQKIVVREIRERNGQKSLLVTGEIRNTRKEAIAVPPIRLVAFDDQGFPVKTQIAVPEIRRRRIAAGAAAPFSYKLQPSPRNATSVVVSFGSNEAPEFTVRARLGCEDAFGFN